MRRIPLELVFQPSVNSSFNGRRSVQLIVKDIRPASDHAPIPSLLLDWTYACGIPNVLAHGRKLSSVQRINPPMLGIPIFGGSMTRMRSLSLTAALCVVVSIFAGHLAPCRLRRWADIAAGACEISPPSSCISITMCFRFPLRPMDSSSFTIPQCWDRFPRLSPRRPHPPASIRQSCGSWAALTTTWMTTRGRRRRLTTDQSASAFRKAGIVMMYASSRGGNGNAGFNEMLYGEVDDIIAAASYLATLPYVDKSRIYLGGHSTGGTLALLVVESTSQFRAVFAFGPTDNMYGYDDGTLSFDTANKQEIYLRSPVLYLNTIKTPTFMCWKVR